VLVHVGLSQMAYDVLRIAAWALVIVGALVVITGLIRYCGARADPRGSRDGRRRRTGRSRRYRMGSAWPSRCAKDFYALPLVPE
jgi:hypothetical protein